MKFTEVQFSKLQCTDNSLIWAICERIASPFKIGNRLVWVKGDVCKDTKNYELQN